MKTYVLNVFLILVSCLISVNNAQAVPSLSGQWHYVLYPDENPTIPIGEGLWTLKQQTVQENILLTGAGSTGSFTWTSVGTLVGNEFTKVDSYNGSSYVLAMTGVVNETASEITGTWNDTLEQDGNFVAQRITPIEFTPETKIEDAPAVIIANKNITISMEKFTKALPKNSGRSVAALSLAAKAGQPKLTIKYEVTVKGQTRQQTRAKVVSKKNEVTIKKLAPGNYTSTYRVQTFQGEKRIYQSNVSPAASFTIR